MAFKLDWQYWFDGNGKIVFGDCSVVPCAEDDPYRLRKIERLPGAEPKEPKESKEKR